MCDGLKHFSKALLEKAREMGYAIVFDKDQLLKLRGVKKVLGLFAWSRIPFVLDRNETT